MESGWCFLCTVGISFANLYQHNICRMIYWTIYPAIYFPIYKSASPSIMQSTTRSKFLTGSLSYNLSLTLIYSLTQALFESITESGSKFLCILDWSFLNRICIGETMKPPPEVECLDSRSQTMMYKCQFKQHPFCFINSYKQLWTGNMDNFGILIRLISIKCVIPTPG